MKPDRLIWGLNDQGRFPSACLAVPWQRRASVCPALPADPEVPPCPPPLGLRGQSGTGPCSWAVSEGRWLPIGVRGRSALPRLQAQESAGAGFHSRQGWGSQDRGRQGKTKHKLPAIQHLLSRLIYGCWSVTPKRERDAQL